jgi:hypothetical protein
MAESTLSITRADLKTAVARRMGLSRTAGDWTTDDSNAVTDIIENGERDFYGPPPLPGEKASHVWSFSTPLLTIGLTANVADYDLPDDFGGFTGNELYYEDQDDVWYTVRITSVAEILKQRGQDELVCDYPRLAATQWLPTGSSIGQRMSLMVWPTPSTSLTLKSQYYSNPSAISDSLPYPLGGQPHGATLRAAVLAAAELEMDGAHGPWREKFMERLMWSVAFDRRSGPKFFGTMNGPDRYATERHRGEYVTYNSVLYNGTE